MFTVAILNELNQLSGAGQSRNQLVTEGKSENPVQSRSNKLGSVRKNKEARKNKLLGD